MKAGRRHAAVLGLAGLAAAGLAAAASAKDAREAAIPLPPIPPPTLDSLPPYQAKLDHLAELMGTLAYLRDLCGAGDGAAWRERMDALLTAEGTTPARRDRLAGSYNRGYSGYQLTYHSCTPVAGTVIARALGEGARLAAEVSTQFGKP